MSKEQLDLYLIEPTSRINVPYLQSDSKSKRAEKVSLAIYDDFFTLRVKQKLWDTFQEKYADKFLSLNEEEVQRILVKLIDEMSIKQVISNVVTRINERSSFHILDASVASSSAPRPSSLASVTSVSRTAKDEKLDFIRHARLQWEQGCYENFL